MVSWKQQVSPGRAPGEAGRNGLSKVSKGYVHVHDNWTAWIVSADCAGDWISGCLVSGPVMKGWGQRSDKGSWEGSLDSGTGSLAHQSFAGRHIVFYVSELVNPGKGGPLGPWASNSRATGIHKIRKYRWYNWPCDTEASCRGFGGKDGRYFSHEIILHCCKSTSEDIWKFK